MEVLLKSLYFCLRYILWGERCSCTQCTVQTLICITVLALLFGLDATNNEEQQDGQAKEVEPLDKHQSIVCESLKPVPPKVATSFSNVFSIPVYEHVIYSHYPEQLTCCYSYCGAKRQ